MAVKQAGGKPMRRKPNALSVRSAEGSRRDALGGWLACFLTAGLTVSALADDHKGFKRAAELVRINNWKEVNSDPCFTLFKNIPPSSRMWNRWGKTFGFPPGTSSSLVEIFVAQWGELDAVRNAILDVLKLIRSNPQDDPFQGLDGNANFQRLIALREEMPETGFEVNGADLSICRVLKRGSSHGNVVWPFHALVAVMFIEFLQLKGWAYLQKCEYWECGRYFIRKRPGAHTCSLLCRKKRSLDKQNGIDIEPIS